MKTKIIEIINLLRENRTKKKITSLSANMHLILWLKQFRFCFPMALSLLLVKISM